MDDSINQPPPELTPVVRRKNYSSVGIIFTVIGLALFAYFIWKADVATVWAGIRRLGYGAAWIMAISAVRTILRAWAWKLCSEKPWELRLIDAWRGYVVGDALGTLTPLGMFASEPAKAAVVRDRVPLAIALSSLAVENIFYSLTAALFVLSGIGTLLITYHLPRTLRYFSIGTVIFVVSLIVILLLMVYREWRIVSRAASIIAKWGIARDFLTSKNEKLRAWEDRVYGFYDRHRARFIPVLALNFGFHLMGVAEIYATLYYISDVPPSLLTAFFLESANRVITVGFKFVPFRAGVDEAGTGMLTKVLLRDLSGGVTLAVIRKARGLIWMLIGLIVWFVRGLTIRENAVEEEAEKMKG
ncbi:MAG: lysylphosphatidylglycerol synthase transmembrane domain-containing protein [Pyrinomonadaceae bacterium]